jgi:molybdopterin-guanine dinucleotide biosynthesis protein MobB
VPHVVNLVARSGAGKTTFLELLIPRLVQRGIRVGVAQPDARRFDMDQPGKDTWRLREAGATAVAISSPTQIAYLERVEAPWDPDALIRLMGSRVELVIAEVRRQNPFPKIEFVRVARDPNLRSRPEELIAIVADRQFDLDIPHFGLDDAEPVAAFLADWMHRTPPYISAPIQVPSPGAGTRGWGPRRGTG